MILINRILSRLTILDNNKWHYWRFQTITISLLKISEDFRNHKISLCTIWHRLSFTQDKITSSFTTAIDCLTRQTSTYSENRLLRSAYTKWFIISPKSLFKVVYPSWYFRWKYAEIQLLRLWANLILLECPHDGAI